MIELDVSNMTDEQRHLGAVVFELVHSNGLKWEDAEDILLKVLNESENVRSYYESSQS